MNIKKSIIVLIVLVSASTIAKADQLMLLSPENAERAAAYLNSQKEVILYCGCCTNDRPLKVTVAEASVEQYKNYGTGIRLKGVDQNKNSINRFIDLAYVWVKAKKVALSLGKVMNLRCRPCVGNLNWKTMQPIPIAENRFYQDSKVKAAIEHLDSTLNTKEYFVFVYNGKALEAVETTFKLDQDVHTLRYEIYNSGLSTLYYSVPIASLKKIKVKNGSIILKAEKGTSFWLQTISTKDFKEKTKSYSSISIPISKDYSKKLLRKQLKQLKKKKKLL